MYSKIEERESKRKMKGREGEREKERKLDKLYKTNQNYLYGFIFLYINVKSENKIVSSF